MHRWLVVFMLVLLPLQFAWAAAAPYCAHETAAAGSKHWGHHPHMHQGGSDTAKGGDDGAGFGADHTDCASCHAGAAASMPLPVADLSRAPRDVLREQPPPRYRSHTPAGPERPDIAELNPAARFGGEVEFRLLPG